MTQYLAILSIFVLLLFILILAHKIINKRLLIIRYKKKFVDDLRGDLIALYREKTNADNKNNQVYIEGKINMVEMYLNKYS